MSKVNQITISDEEIKEIFYFLYKEIELVKKGTNLLVVKNNKNLAIIRLNEYGSIIGLTLPRRYGYLNTFILRKILGLIYKGGI